MVIETQDTRRSGTEHFDRNPFPQAHFFESVDELVATVKIADATLLTAPKHIQGNDLRHNAVP